MNETNIMQGIRLALSKIGVRIFRNNVAMAWTGRSVKNKDGSITIYDPRPLHAGLTKGSGDLIGWITRVITPEMVGSKVAVFVSVEVKQPSKKPSPEQSNWMQAVKLAGGIAGVAVSDKMALDLLK